MRMRWMTAAGVVGALAAPGLAQENGAGTPAEQLAQGRAILAEATPEGAPPNDDLLWKAFWSLKPLVDGPLAGDADAHFAAAQCAFTLAPMASADMARGLVWPLALASSLRCVELNRNHPEGWLLYGKVRSHAFNGSNWGEALPGFENDLVLTPTRLESHQWCAFGYLQLGQPDKATAAARRGLESNPDAARLHELLGDALFQLQDYLGARAAYGDAAEREPTNHAPIDKWVNADLRAQEVAGPNRDPGPALAWLAEFDAAHPDHWKAGEKRAEIYIVQMWQGVWTREGAGAARPHGEAGLAQLAALAARFPDEPRGVHWMQLAASVHRAYAAYDALVDCVLDGIRRATGDFEATETIMGELANADRSLNLFDEYRNTGQWERCLALVDRLLEVLPAETILESKRRGVLHKVRSDCFESLGRHDEAEAAFSAAMEADPADPVYPNSYGLMLRYLGRTDEAIARFRQSLEISAGHPWPSENLAATLLMLGRWDEFFPHMAAALGFAADRVTGAHEHLQKQIAGGDRDEIAAAQETLEDERFYAASLRHLYIEGLRLQAAERARK